MGNCSHCCSRKKGGDGETRNIDENGREREVPMFIVEEIGIQYAKADGDNERRPSENKFKI